MQKMGRYWQKIQESPSQNWDRNSCCFGNYHYCWKREFRNRGIGERNRGMTKQEGYFLIVDTNRSEFATFSSNSFQISESIGICYQKVMLSDSVSFHCYFIYSPFPVSKSPLLLLIIAVQVWQNSQIFYSIFNALFTWVC